MTKKELKKLIREALEEVKKENSKKPLNEMRVRDLNDISRIVDKDDFYAFINAGNNIIRDLEHTRDISACKKYLIYLVRNNIM
tara:strand:+ start:394 stop:642 length:249 start_codon:yes stop_codon:yes gene_type:complete